MKVSEYIEKYRNEICYIQCFVNRKNILDISNKYTQCLITAKDGPVSCFTSNLNLSSFILNSIPKKVYLFSKEEYELIILDLSRETSISKNKKALIFLFGPEVLENDNCSAYTLEE